MYPSPEASGGMGGPGDKPWLAPPSRISDLVVSACRAIVAATSPDQLTGGVAAALAGQIADWVIVDARPGGQMTRSVAGPDRRLAAQLTKLKPEECPLTVTAARRAAPIVHAHADDRTLLGQLPGGREAADAVGASSIAAAPMTAGDQNLGAIVIIRSGRSSGGTGGPISFNELRVLAEIAELAGTALAARRPGGRP